MKSLKSISTALRDTAAARSTSKGSGKRVRWAADVRDPASSGGLGAAVLVLDAALENVSTLTHSLTHSLFHSLLAVFGYLRQSQFMPLLLPST